LTLSTLIFNLGRIERKIGEDADFDSMARLELVDQKIGKLEGKQVESIGKEIERAKRGMGDGRGSSSSVSSCSSSEGEEGTWGWI